MTDRVDNQVCEGGDNTEKHLQEADALLKKCFTNLEKDSFEINGQPFEVIAKTLKNDLDRFHKDYLVGEKINIIDWEKEWLERFGGQLIAIRRLVEMNADFVGKKALLEQIETINYDINFLLTKIL